MLKMKRLTEAYSMRVYTDEGDFFGELEEAILTSTKIHSWRVKATSKSYLSKVLGNAKGVIVPHGLVKSVGDVMIISKTAAPALAEGE